MEKESVWSLRKLIDEINEDLSLSCDKLYFTNVNVLIIIYFMNMRVVRVVSFAAPPLSSLAAALLSTQLIIVGMELMIYSRSWRK